MRATQPANVCGGRGKKLRRDPGLRFAYRLARGNARWKSGHEAVEELTPSELNYWIASYKLDPWGGEYERTSQMVARIVNAIRVLEAVMGGRKLEGDWQLSDDELVPFRKLPKASTEEMRKSVETLESIVGLPT